MTAARLSYDRLGRPVLEDSDGVRWLVREESPYLVFVSESGDGEWVLQIG